MKCIIDAGHYYLSHGPTMWSQVGWSIAMGLQKKGDASLLFIDDVHTNETLHVLERSANVIEFDPDANFKLFESKVESEALEMLEMLKKLSKKKRAKQNGEGKWFCSGGALTTSCGEPICSLLDAGLSLRKLRMGFSRGINILPYFYEGQQQHLLQILAKTIPEFSLQIILFNEDGSFRYLN